MPSPLPLIPILGAAIIAAGIDLTGLAAVIASLGGIYVAVSANRARNRGRFRSDADLPSPAMDGVVRELAKEAAELRVERDRYHRALVKAGVDPDRLR